jgi:hypothetical protein
VVAAEAVPPLAGNTELALRAGGLALLTDHPGHRLLVAIAGDGDSGDSTAETAHEDGDEDSHWGRDTPVYGRRWGDHRRRGQDLGCLLVRGRFPAGSAALRFVC